MRSWFLRRVESQPPNATVIGDNVNNGIMFSAVELRACTYSVSSEVDLPFIDPIRI